MFRTRSAGRGKHYGPMRGVVEAVLGALYVGEWPARLWGHVPGACDVRVVRRELALLAPGAPPIRVGFVSDLHVGPTTPRAILDRAARVLDDATLDVLLLGGDYVFLEASSEKGAVLSDVVGSIRARHKLAVMGNHDLWTEHAIVERALERAGVHVLVNEAVPLEGACLVGLDEPWTGEPDPSVFENARQEDGVIVLCHAPEGMPIARRALGERPTLFVCGHTHGGHFAAPWGPIVVPGAVGRRHPAGEYTFGEMTMVVSRGVGGIEIAPRAFAPPDVLIFELGPRGSVAL